MKLVDANLLLYAINSDSPLHRPAREWLERTLSGTETVGFTWTVLLAVLRLSTRSVVFPSPLTLEQAFELVDSWLAQPCATILEPTDAHARVLRDLLLPVGAGGNLTSDAHLAAVAIEHGAELCSCDTDFARFPGLRWTNPLLTA
ncbi:MAG: type II toxin-antitoxin system VapC family toxin [Planctomycetota bacterium]|nr:type II toxin-antitoxin system VapC family toxin [Planctomycetota bacterium]